MDALTAQQQRVLDFLHGFVRSKGFPPTVRETMRHFGFASTNAVSDVLAVLERKGYIERSRRVARGIRILRTKSSCNRRLAS